MSPRILRLFLLAGLMFIALSNFGYAQTLPDFSTINVEELSDQQLQSLVSRATAMGYSQSDLFELAKQQGLSMNEISKLGERINKVNSARAAKAESSPISDPRLRRMYGDSLRTLEKRETNIFGLNFFRRNSQFLTFSPSINTPTPSDYELATGDELFIDIYGASEQYYQAVINPDGNIILENVGPVNLSGLTIASAKTKLMRKLGALYTDLASAGSNTFMDLSLGKVRSIQVSIVGEVELPGTYTLNAFSTVFNSLYVSGGITERGTLRAINVVRNGKPIAKVDVYDFLVNGNATGNIRLQNDDVIIVGPYTNRITLKGAVKIPGRFELKENETVADLLKYAGGFDENGYSDKLSVDRNQGKERIVADVFKDQYALFNVKAGDVYQVQSILNRYGNRVQIRGAVARPGDYAINDDLSVKELIEKADGTTGDANLIRAYVVRTNKDLSLSTIPFNLGDLLNGAIPDISLQREDVVRIISIYDLKEEVYVEISGFVNNVGVYPYTDSLTIEDLLVMSGGFREAASASRIEITRRFGNSESGDIAEIMVLDVDRNLEINETLSEFLKPYDYVVVRKNPNFFQQQFVSIEGQIIYPGKYAINNLDDKISDLLERAGGLNQYAYAKGATLLRKTEFYQSQTDLEQRVDDLESLLIRLEKNDSTLSESQTDQLGRIKGELELLNSSDDLNQSLSSFAKRERLTEIVQRNALYTDIKPKEAEPIGIDLEGIINNPESESNLILEKGDVLIIPKKQETVLMRGRLLYPTTVRHQNGKSVKYYVNKAGGFDTRAKKGGTYVIYANGDVARTKKFLFFRNYPKVETGAEIIVPAKAPKSPFRAAELIGITTGLATLALLISQINTK
jgi:protein involved in polysaccharide export with SLBB domain